MTKLHRSLLATLIGLALLGAVPAIAQEQLAEVENLGDTLVFHPVTEFAQLILTVTGPCDYQFQQTVSKGEPIFQLDRETTIDGVYTYDLVRVDTIDPDIIEQLQKARGLGDEEFPRALCRAGKLPGPPVSQSEGFRVLQGEIVYDPRSVEKAAGVVEKSGPTTIATKDFVIIDDLIVDGSACIGFDCVNGESFGFDTLRLKENNLRIKFDDTSTAASFPRNDWQLTANDSANGGASKFSIDDISGSRTPFTVEANARSHSLYVDDGGRIGSRTSTPSTEIHTIDGDTPTLRLQQDGSSGFAPQTWDVAGNETNFFIRDVTNGSQLPLRIRPDAPTSSIDIQNDGAVTMAGNSTNGDADVHVKSTATADAIIGLGVSPDFSGGNENAFVFGYNGNAGEGEGFIGTRPSPGGDGDISFFIENTLEMTLSSSGLNLAAGNDYSVNGVALNVPDFVFGEEYPLMPIGDLASFVATEKHLPGIPSEDEIKNGGLGLGGFQMKLLEKVEELTLYTIDQESKIWAVQQENKELRSLNEELQARLAALEKALLP